jgi:hypothetical protein
MRRSQHVAVRRPRLLESSHCSLPRSARIGPMSDSFRTRRLRSLRTLRPSSPARHSRHGATTRWHGSVPVREFAIDLDGRAGPLQAVFEGRVGPFARRPAACPTGPTGAHGPFRQCPDFLPSRRIARTRSPSLFFARAEGVVDEAGQRLRARRLTRPTPRKSYRSRKDPGSRQKCRRRFSPSTASR